MTTKKQQRAYEKRRFEEWTQRRGQRYARQRKIMRLAGVVGIVALVLGGVTWGVMALIGPDHSLDAAAKDVKDQASASPSASATGSASPSDPNNPCPAAPTTTTKPAATLTKPAPTAADRTTSTVKLATTCGDLTIELDGTKAPQATAVMRQLAQAKFFNDPPCHRLTTTGIYVLQCGDPTRTGTGGPGYNFGPIENAPKGDLYPAGTIAMARASGNPNSMGSQFFIVYQDSTIPSDSAGGYTVVGRVLEGLDVVTKVAQGGATPVGDGAPVRGINIVSAELV